MIAIQSAGVPVGAAAGVIAAGFILSNAHDWSIAGWPLLGDLAPWQLAFFLIGLPGLGFAFLALTLWEPDREIKIARQQPIGPYLRENGLTFACFAVGMGFAGMAMQNLSTWSPEYLRRVFDAAPFAIGAKMGGIAFMAAIVGQIGSGLIVDRLTMRGVAHAPARFYPWLVALVAPLAFLAFAASSEKAFLLGLFLMLTLLMPSISLGTATMQMLAPPPLRARLSALYGIVVYIIAFAIGPSLVGFMSQHVFGEARLGLALATATVASALVSLMLLLVAGRRMAGGLDRSSQSEPDERQAPEALIEPVRDGLAVGAFMSRS